MPKGDFQDRNGIFRGRKTCDLTSGRTGPKDWKELRTGAKDWKELSLSLNLGTTRRKLSAKKIRFQNPSFSCVPRPLE